MQEVDQWLERQLQPDRPFLAPLLEHARRFRGKRLRAAQVLLIGKACGKLSDDHIGVAGIIELIHAATLIHDDLLDDATERRGFHCLHVEWGSHASVLLGDWIYARAFRRSTELSDTRCSQVLAAATERICRGEIHQNVTCGDFDLNEAEYIDQIDGKTAALYEAGGLLAAHYSDAPEQVQQACANHGLYAGRAFQIMDDVLDLIGDPDRTRKSLGTDWAGGKMTLPLIRLRDSLPSQEAERLKAQFGNGNPREYLSGPSFVEPLEQALAQCRADISTYLADACAALQNLPEGEERAALIELTEFLGARQF